MPHNTNNVLHIGCKLIFIYVALYDRYVARKFFENIFDMASRKLKVYNSYRSGDKKAVPEVRLIGKWLERSGFQIGKHVYIIINDQEIIIKPLG